MAKSIKATAKKSAGKKAAKKTATKKAAATNAAKKASKKATAKKSAAAIKKSVNQKKSPATKAHYEEGQTPYSPQMQSPSQNPSYDDRNQPFHTYDEAVYQRQHSHGSYAHPPESDFGDYDMGSDYSGYDEGENYRETMRPRGRPSYAEDSFQDYPSQRNRRPYEDRYQSSGRQPRYIDERNHDYSADYDEHYSYHPQADEYYRRQRPADFEQSESHGPGDISRQNRTSRRSGQEERYSYNDRLQQHSYPQGGGGRPQNPVCTQSDYGGERGAYEQQYSRRPRSREYYDDYDDHGYSQSTGPRRRR